MQAREISITLDGSGEASGIETGVISGLLQMVVLSKEGQTANPAITITTADGYAVVDGIAESGATPTPYLIRVPPVEPDATAITVQFEPFPNAGNMTISVASGDAAGVCKVKLYWGGIS